MAQSQSGKWVSRVASTGGGRTYKSQRPSAYYAALVVIVVLGLGSVLLARSYYQSNASSTTAAGVQPLANTKTFAAFGIDVCGTVQGDLPAATSTAFPLYTQGSNVVTLAPKSSTDAGTNATAVLFSQSVPGLTITTNELKIPKIGSQAAQTFKTGDACPKGTPDAGKQGKVQVSYWKTFADNAPQISTDPAALHFTPNSLLTVAFVPDGSKIAKPSSTTVSKMLQASQQAITTPTTAASTTTTAVRIGSTTTSAPVTTTTAAG